jgi:hypothetical protein
MRGKSDVSRLFGGISSDHEFGEYLRRLLRAAVEPIEPADGGLKRIRARVGQRPRRAAGSRAGGQRRCPYGDTHDAGGGLAPEWAVREGDHHGGWRKRVPRPGTITAGPLSR